MAPIDVSIHTVGDNCMYLLIADGAAAVVDPTSATPLLSALAATGATLTWILVTHPHADHTAGCERLQAQAGGTVAGPGMAHPVSDGDTLTLGGHNLQVLSVPGHTATDVAYLAREDRMLWTGDVLFAAGCGRVFSGHYEQMWNSLKRLRSLPSDTCVYPGHDYTLENLEFAAHIEPENADIAARLQQVRTLVEHGQPTVPTTLTEEQHTNPFLRADTPAMRTALTMPNNAPEDIFETLRRRKDRW